MKKTILIKNQVWNILKSNRKNKQLKAIRQRDNFIVHFGDPNMAEYPGTKRGDNYCTRSYGIGNINNPESANFWSRKILWRCVGKKSIK